MASKTKAKSGSSVKTKPVAVAPPLTPAAAIGRATSSPAYSGFDEAASRSANNAPIYTPSAAPKLAFDGTIGGNRVQLYGDTPMTQDQAIAYMRNQGKEQMSTGSMPVEQWQALNPGASAADLKSYKQLNSAYAAQTNGMGMGDKIANAGKFELNRAGNLLNMDTVKQALTGGIDPIGTKIGNAITGSNNEARVSQLGGATEADFKRYEDANGFGSLGAARAMSHSAEAIAGMIGGAQAGSALSGAFSGASPVFTTSNEVGGLSSALPGSVSEALPEILVQGTRTAGNLGALGSLAGATPMQTYRGGSNQNAQSGSSDEPMDEIVVNGTRQGMSPGQMIGLGAGGVGAGMLLNGDMMGSFSNPATNGNAGRLAQNNGIEGGSGQGSAPNSGFGGSDMGWLDWAKEAANLYGAYQSSQGNKDARNDLNNARLTTTLGGGSITGPGGAGAALSPDGKGGSYGLGDMEGMRAFLAQLGTQQSQAALTGGLPDNIKTALAGVTGAQGLNGMPDTTGLQNDVNGVRNQSLSDINGGIKGVTDNYLSTLRAQAKPEETRMMDDLQNRQFSMGQLGSSGGALQTEAFARGLGQADLSRQLSATNMGQSLLNDAFGRFGQTTNLSSDLTQQRFGNATLQNNTAFDRANTNLGNQINAAQLPAALQGSQLALALQALNGQGALQDQGLQQFQAALAAANSGANARIGAGSVNAQLAGQRAAIPSSSDMWGQVLTGMASRMGNSDSGQGGIQNILSGLFNGNKTAQPVSNTYGTYPGMG